MEPFSMRDIPTLSPSVHHLSSWVYQSTHRHIVFELRWSTRHFPIVPTLLALSFSTANSFNKTRVSNPRERNIPPNRPVNSPLNIRTTLPLLERVRDG
ncbi:hypothetical protein ACHAXM_003240 [Skeletonema potamos]